MSTLRRGSILTLKGDMPFESGETKHHFVVLNYNPDSGEYLVAVNNTSHVVSRLIRLQSNGTENISETTIVFEPGEYEFFPEQTLFDCNSVHEITAAELARAHTLNNLSIPSDNVQLSEEHIEILVQAALKSRSVSPVNKKLIKPDFE